MSGIIEFFRNKLKRNKQKAVLDYIKTRGTSYSNGTGKSIISPTETLTLTTQTKRLIEKVKEDMLNLERTAAGKSEILIKYVEEKGTKVYRIKNASKSLEKIKEHTGFISPLQGGKALYINTLLKIGVSSDSEALFIIDEEKVIDYYMLLREVYLWCSMSQGLGGFEFEAQELFKKYLLSSEIDMSKLDYAQMCSLKEAVARDAEANEFVMEVIRLREGGKQVLDKANGGGVEI